MLIITPELIENAERLNSGTLTEIVLISRTARPIVLNLSFPLPVLDQSIGWVGPGEDSAHCTYMVQTSHEGQRPRVSLQQLPRSNHFIAPLWRHARKTHGKSSKPFGMDIKDTLRCQFQFPHSLRHSQGRRNLAWSSRWYSKISTFS